MEALSDALGWTGKADRSSFWLPWANMKDGEIAPTLIFLSKNIMP